MESVSISDPLNRGFNDVLTPEAVNFIAMLTRKFRPEVDALLARRQERQRRLDVGEEALGFLPATAHIRDGKWKVAPIPHNLRDRRVEITGPASNRKGVINALNSRKLGTRVFMADGEDAESPTYDNLINGQQNLMDAIDGSITYTDPISGKQYQLDKDTAILMYRPRGWHLWEKHLVVDGRPVPAALFDAGLYIFHNSRLLLSKGSGPYLYLPKMQSYLEAELWENVLSCCEEAMVLEQGTIKVTCLIETLPAVFEMDEILFSLKERCLGLNCGRWDYLFSMIKTLRTDPNAVLPNRSQVTMEAHCMKAYALLLIQTCHRRGAFAMGGMAAQIPIKENEERHRVAMDKVRADKLREVKFGHDGTWVAHPGLVALAVDIFNTHMPAPNQIDRQLDVWVTADDLLRVPQGERTEEELRHNIRVNLAYMEAWFVGQGCVPLYDLMEDAATAEICRCLSWQWLRHLALVSGTPLTLERFQRIFDDEVKQTYGRAPSEGGAFDAACKLFYSFCIAEELPDFLTVEAYKFLA